MSLRAVAKAVLGVAAVSLWGLAPGCGPSVAGYCNKVCDCTGCSESEKDQCVDYLEEYKETAEEAGCGGEFNDALGCVTSELECDGDSPDIDGCDSENEELEECLSGGGPGPGGSNACEVYQDTVVDKYVECGIDAPEVGEVPECSDEQAQQAACLTQCVDFLPCGCLTGESCTEEESQSYSDCVSSCI